MTHLADPETKMEEVYRALVVEDDAVAREAAITALQDQGFQCQWAEDGVKATSAVGRSNFDVVVTDLRLPRRNGHDLAIELAGRGSPRPLVIVLTGVLEPRLVKDLISRGVDGIDFKPVDFGVFGAKVRALCDRRRRQESIQQPATDSCESSNLNDFQCERVTAGQIEERLDSLAGLLPVSPAALKVARIVQENKPSPAEVASAVSHEPLLTVEVLLLANSGQFRPSGRRIDSLKQAVTWIGDRQIGELAVALATSNALSKVQLPWMNSGLVWRRSVASSLAIKRMLPAAVLNAEDEGLFLSSLVLPLSRVVLCLAFPDLYAKMVAYCRQHDCSLAALERRTLTLSPCGAMAGILARWNLSPGMCKPLQHAGLSYAELTSLTEPLRSKVERLRVAELIAQISVGQFESWDEIDLPSEETISRLRTDDLGSIVEQVRGELSQSKRLDTIPCAAIVSAPVAEPRTVRYTKLAVDCRDLLATLVQAIGFQLDRVARDAACVASPALVNCLDVSPERLEWFLDDAIPESKRTLICNSPLPPHTVSWGPIIQLPCSFHALAQGITTAATP